MPEQYVRPPLVAHEPPSHALAVWRFRIVAGLLLAVLAVVVVLLFLKFSDITAEDPGFGVGLGRPAAGPSSPG